MRKTISVRNKSLKIITVVLLLIFSSGLAFGQTPGRMPPEMSAKEKQKYQDQIKELTAQINSKGPSVENSVKRAKAFYVLGDYKAAIGDYSRVIELSPGNGEYYAERGVLNLLTKQYANSWKDFLKANELHYKVDPAFMVALQAASPEDAKAVTKSMNPPIMSCVIDKDAACLAKILSEGVDVNTANRLGQTALMVAISNGDKESTKLLLEKGAAVDAKDKYGMTPLMVAAGKGDSYFMELLLGKGVKIDEKDMAGKTALTQAILNNKIEAVRFLIGKGADVNSQDKDQQSGLIWAVISFDPDMVKLLLEKGAKKDLKNSSGLTALDYAQGLLKTSKMDQIIRLLGGTPGNVPGKKQAAPEQKAPAGDYNSFFDEADRYFHSGDTERAISTLKKCLEAYPNDFYALGKLGSVYLFISNYEEAIVYYKKAAQIKPDDGMIQMGLGSAFLMTHKLDGARASFEIAKKDSQLRSKAISSLGNTYVKMKELDKAMACFQENIANKVNDPADLVGMGMVYYYRRDGVNARKYLTQAKQAYESKGDRNTAQNIANIINTIPK